MIVWPRVWGFFLFLFLVVFCCFFWFCFVLFCFSKRLKNIAFDMEGNGFVCSSGSFIIILAIVYISLRFCFHKYQYVNATHFRKIFDEKIYYLRAQYSYLETFLQEIYCAPDTQHMEHHDYVVSTSSPTVNGFHTPRRTHNF